MRNHQLHRHTWLPIPIERTFAFFCDPGNLQRITPAELDLVIDEAPRESLFDGAEIRYRLKLWGVPFRWRTRIVLWKPPQEFVDVGIRSPFRRWEHRHVLAADGDGTAMFDLVDYALPLWPVGEIAHSLVRRQLERIFDFRENTIQQIFARSGERAA